MATFSELYINNVKMPTPAVNGITITYEKIWSEDTGRCANGLIVGTIVSIKTKLEIKWPTLTLAQADTINSAVSSDTPFLPVRFTDEGGTTRTLSMYAGTPTFTQYSWAQGIQYVTGVEVHLIER